MKEQGFQVLREEFLQRKKKNSSYSTRAFARDLGVSQAYISLLLAGKRKLSLANALKFAQVLHLSQDKKSLFLQGSEKMNSEKKDGHNRETVYSLDLELFRTISEWYHLAILDLTTTENFRADIHWVARKLGISSIEVRDAVGRLERLDLLLIKNGRWLKTKTHLHFPTKSSSVATQTYHQQMIEKALNTLLTERNFDAREISGTTMAVNSKRLPKAKKKIQDFQKKLAAYLTQGPCDQLYQVNVQLFSLLKGEDK